MSSSRMVLKIHQFLESKGQQPAPHDPWDVMGWGVNVEMSVGFEALASGWRTFAGKIWCFHKLRAEDSNKGGMSKFHTQNTRSV